MQDKSEKLGRGASARDHLQNTDALDRPSASDAAFCLNASVDRMLDNRERLTPLMRTSSSAAASSTRGVDDQYISLNRFGSLDSSDTFLSCNTHPFPSQGSLAGLEELAAVGSMAANGSMPAVNIPGFNNRTGLYMNPFDPHSRRSRKGDRVQQLAQSPRGSPSRRVRIAGRSLSSDLELEGTGGNKRDKIIDANVPGSTCDVSSVAPKHRRTRVSLVILVSFLTQRPLKRFGFLKSFFC